MASIGTLWTTPAHYTGICIRAVASFGDLKLDLADYKHREDNHKPEFRSKFPHGKIPTFEGKDGFTLFETQAIARYVASLAPNSTLLGASPKEAALVDQWVSFANYEFGMYSQLINQLVVGFLTPYNKPIHTAFMERQHRAWRTLNQHLATTTFLVSERITLADITVAAFLKQAFKLSFDEPLRKELTHVVRFYETVANHPKIKDVFGQTEYVAKALQYTPPPKEKAKVEKKPEEKKVEKKPKKEEVEEEDDDDEKLLHEAPKEKNPLDLLPKSNFNLEDWKRAYSNMDTRGKGGALEWFYEKFDKEGFSVWRVTYKYNEELTQTYMSSNLVGGFFNRLEASRKYAFGSMSVLGTANNSIIAGTFIVRGQDYLPVMNVAPDWESYEYKRLDLSNPADKAYFESALAWDLDIDGKKAADSKAFK